jgi:hypothetical protein
MFVARARNVTHEYTRKENGRIFASNLDKILKEQALAKFVEI